MSLHWLDIVVIICLAFTTFNGVRRGFIRSVFDILAMMVAVFVSIAWYQNLAFLLIPYLKIPEMLANVISFTLSWLVVFWAVSLLGGAAHKVLGKTFFASFNFLGGGLLGLAKGLIIIGLVVNLILAFPLPDMAAAELRKSVALEWSLPMISLLYKNIFKVVPQDVPYVSEFFKAAP